MSTRGHVDEPGCDCGGCEPATGGNPMGVVLSGNPGCDFPNCVIMGVSCMWGDTPCFDFANYPEITGREIGEGS